MTHQDFEPTWVIGALAEELVRLHAGDTEQTSFWRQS